MPYVKQERRPALDKVVDELKYLELEPKEMELFLYHLAFGVRSLWPNRLSAALGICRSAGVKPNGDINYIIFKYCKYHVKPSYNNYKRFMGEVYRAAHNYKGVSDDFKDEYRESEQWIRIELLTPYEREKIIENGDV